MILVKQLSLKSSISGHIYLKILHPFLDPHPVQNTITSKLDKAQFL